MKTFISLLVAFCLVGCASSRLSTRIAVQVGDGFLKTSEIGLSEMKRVIVAWPYVSGQIKAIPYQEDNISGQARKVIERLDTLSTQQDWTKQECGEISTLLVLIEYYSIQFGWDKYGVTVTKWIKAFIGG